MAGKEKKRPSIPKGMQRQILLESGHRCAIHTCRHPSVEIHHIVPWHICLEHNFDNLIALCPNCHARADKCEIDRLSLMEYKSRLKAGVGLEKLPVGKLTCLRRTIIDTSVPNYEIEIVCPMLSGRSENIDQVNSIFLTRFVDSLHGLRASYDSLSDITPKFDDMKASLSVTYQLSFLNDDLVSVVGTYYHDGCPLGAAHPNHSSFACNYALKPAFPLRLDNIFDYQSEYLDFLSEYARDELTPKLISEPEEHSWRDLGIDMEFVCDMQLSALIQGTEPIAENFSNFRVTAQSLIFTFDEYQVADYVAGAQEVEIPYGAITHLLSKRSPLMLAKIENV